MVSSFCRKFVVNLRIKMYKNIKMQKIYIRILPVSLEYLIFLLIFKLKGYKEVLRQPHFLFHYFSSRLRA